MSATDAARNPSRPNRVIAASRMDCRVWAPLVREEGLAAM
jgi:hypothetical protein